MDTHGVDVLDAAHNDAVVVAIADDLQLVFLPTERGFIDQDLANHGGVKPAPDQILELIAVVGDAAARAAKGEGGTDDGRQADLLQKGPGVFQAGDGGGIRLLQTDAIDDAPEFLPVLGLVNHIAGGTDHLDAGFRERPLIKECTGAIQGGLPAERGKEGIDGRPHLFFLGDDFPHRFRGDGLDVRPVGEHRVGHNGGGIGIDEHDPVAFLAESLAGLGAGVVKLTALPDHNGTGAKNQDVVDVVSSGHSVEARICANFDQHMPAPDDTQTYCQ